MFKIANYCQIKLIKETEVQYTNRTVRLLTINFFFYVQSLFVPFMNSVSISKLALITPLKQYITGAKLLTTLWKTKVLKIPDVLIVESF